MVSLRAFSLAAMVVTFHYRLLPSKAQHHALERILESQRQLYNAALEERIGAYRNARVTRTYIDQSKALTEWRQSDADATELPVTLSAPRSNAWTGHFKDSSAA